MSGNVELTWDMPTERVDGVPLAPAELETRIGLRAVGAADFTPLQVVDGTENSVLNMVDQAGGNYEFSLVLYDKTLDRVQPAIIAPFVVPAGDANPITNVSVSVT
jgi:hypothetical protein